MSWPTGSKGHRRKVFSDRAASHPPGAPLEPQVRALAAKNKCLADSNKTRTADEVTNERLHPVTPTTPVVQIGAASAFCRAGAVPPHAHCAHPTARKNCCPCLAVELKFIGRHQRQHLTG